MIEHVFHHSLEDTLKLIPFLFLTYLIMEYLEHKSKHKSKDVMRSSGHFGPLIGGLVGAFPQCGFSAAAASLYAGGVITTGTLLSIFLSTSDEMLPIFISEAVPASTIFKILGLKVVIGTISGFAIDFLWRLGGKKRKIHDEKKHIHREHHDKDIHDLCQSQHCHCEEGHFVKSAIMHTLQIALFILIITFAIGLVVHSVGKENIGNIIGNKPVIGTFLAALVGLIPNCAASVIITQLYLTGILGAGQMMAGLLVSAGVGILVLCRTNKGYKENLGIIGLLYATGVFWGILIEILGILI